MSTSSTLTAAKNPLPFPSSLIPESRLALRFLLAALENFSLHASPSLIHSSVIGTQSAQQERRGIVVTFSREIVGDGGGSEVRRVWFTWGEVAADDWEVEVEVEEVVLQDEPDV